jgi:hypothetical protein
LAFVLKGSDTINGRVKSIRMLGGATAYGELNFRIDRWSDAGTIGSAVLSSAVTPGKHDPTNAAHSILLYTVGTANWTTRGTLTTLANGRLPFVPITTAATSSDGRAVEFAAAPRSSQDWVIRGASDWIVIDFLGGAIPSGGVVDLMVEVEEDPYLGAQS